MTEKTAAGTNQLSKAEQFGRLYEEHLPGIYRFVSYRVGNNAVSEDLTSDIFRKALDNFHRFDASKASFSTWIYTIAKNTLVDYYRRNAGDRKHTQDIETEYPATAVSPEETLLKAEEFGKLRECFLKLKKPEQEIIALKFGSGMTNREIAAVTGLSESNVGTILCRTIRRLRDDFSGWEHNG